MLKKMLNESYGDDMGQMGGQQMYAQQGQPMPNGEEGYVEANEGAEGAPFEGEAPQNNVIDQIRQLAIKGIAEYADDIESEQYQSLKKIWLLTDKFYEDLQGDDEKRK